MLESATVKGRVLGCIRCTAAIPIARASKLVRVQLRLDLVEGVVRPHRASLRWYSPAPGSVAPAHTTGRGGKLCAVVFPWLPSASLPLIRHEAGRRETESLAPPRKARAPAGETRGDQGSKARARSSGKAGQGGEGTAGRVCRVGLAG